MDYQQETMGSSPESMGSASAEGGLSELPEILPGIQSFVFVLSFVQIC